MSSKSKQIINERKENKLIFVLFVLFFAFLINLKTFAKIFIAVNTALDNYFLTSQI